MKTTNHSSKISAKVSIFFTEIAGGCNYNDDPVEVNVYCELVINTDKATAETKIDIFSK